jgi:hypothetical protein
MYLKINIRSGDIYDKETIKICNQLSSLFMAGKEVDPPSLQQRETNGTFNDEIETQNGI